MQLAEKGSCIFFRELVCKKSELIRLIRTPRRVAANAAASGIRVPGKADLLANRLHGPL